MPKRDALVKYTPQRLPGRWRRGYSLDLHTISSTFLGYDEFGNEKFDTKYTELGERLHGLKYQDDRTALDAIIAAALDFLRKQSWRVEFVVPIPPSRPRDRQPVIMIANALAERHSIPCLMAFKKRGSSPELKSVAEFSERIQLLENVLGLSAAAKQLKNSRVLLLDDLWRSGATLNAAAALLLDGAGVADVFALTITKTRVNR